MVLLYKSYTKYYYFTLLFFFAVICLTLVCIYFYFTSFHFRIRVNLSHLLLKAVSDTSIYMVSLSERAEKERGI